MWHVLVEESVESVKMETPSKQYLSIHFFLHFSSANKFNKRVALKGNERVVYMSR